MVIEYDKKKLLESEIYNKDTPSDIYNLSRFLLVFNDYLSTKLGFKVTFEMCFVIDGSTEETFYKHVIYNLKNDEKKYVLFKNIDTVRQIIFDFDLHLMIFINSESNSANYRPMLYTFFSNNSTLEKDKNNLMNNTKNNSCASLKSENSASTEKKKFLGKFGLNLCKQFLITDETSGSFSLFLKSKVYKDNQHIPLLLTKISIPHCDLNLKVCSSSKIKTDALKGSAEYENFYKLSIISILNKKEDSLIIDIKLPSLLLLLQKKIANKQIRNISEFNNEMLLTQRSMSVSDDVCENSKSSLTKNPVKAGPSGSNFDKPNSDQPDDFNGNQ